MTVLVTGGAGFLGSRVCRALLDRGEWVVALDNFDPFYPESIKRSNLADLRGRGFRFVRGPARSSGTFSGGAAPRPWSTRRRGRGSRPP